MHDDDRGDDLASKLARLSPARRMLLAKRLAAAGVDAPGLPILPMPRAPGAEHPLSFAQHGLWLVEQLHPHNVAYNLAVAARIEGPLDASALAGSFERLAMRHEGLRVQLRVRGGIPAQRVTPEPETGLVLAHADDPSQAMQRCAEEARRPFELAGGPLWRAVLLRTGAHEHAIVLVLHHILADNWSMGVFGRELGRCYEALARGETPRLPELPIQYIDFASWQRGRIERGALDEALSYWRQRLQGAALAPRMPADRTPPLVQSHQGARRPFDVDGQLTASLRTLCARSGVTLFMVLVAALQALLHRYTGEDRITVGTDVAGRDRAELEGIMGLFVNQVVLCTDLAGNPTSRELLARVREVCMGAYSHREVPFHKVVEAVNPTRALDRTPLFQVKIDLLDVPLGAVSLPGLVVTPIPLEGSAKFDLELIVWNTGSGLHGFFEYSTDLFDAVTIDRAIEHMTTLLEQLAADPDQRILDIPLVGEHRGAAVRFAADEEFSFDP